MADLAHTIAFEAWVDEARSVDLAGYARDRVALRRSGSEWSGPCPGCGGRDRFSISTRKGVWHCRQLERDGAKPGGDVIALVQHVEGCDFLRACEILTDRPAPGRDMPETEAERAARRDRQRAQAAAREAAAAEEAEAEAQRRLAELKRARAFWDAAVRDLSATPAAAYLRLRGLTAPPGARLRFLPRHPLYTRREDPRGRPTFARVHEGPALLAGMIGPDDRFAGVHQTWIDLADPDGKARIADPVTGEILPARKVRGTKRGARIELVRRPEPETLILGEGLETCLSVREALLRKGEPLAEEAALWATLDLGNLAGLTPVPDSVRRLILLGDGDSDPAATAEALARGCARYARPGRHVGIAWAEPGRDFNDMLRSAA
ncbi:DNA primase [Methylobacterium mesophilicum SR1.6/6]|uniref:DNA primase n=1 Tax=Methylobacterium mesophilicum SR1.6/6 TaxID=908290 RepID=A0A6B9FK31_9HYPH|nr:toprim domain-containing protein [Methylobacterium mesophilicum]QGY01494.1 DNA primase [Methylobacterium mesophilicum SR1.6/6]